MTSGAIVAIVIVVIIVVALLAFAPAALRRRRLQKRFGPEYDRAVADAGSRREAEAELAEREKRVHSLEIRPLDRAALDTYIRQWNAVQEQFVDAPAKSVTSAQGLITDVLKDRGYPTKDSSQIMSDLSVDYARTLAEFRTAQELSGRAARGSATTEDLRQAMVHYRSLFRELLDEPAGLGARSVASGSAATGHTPPDGTPIPRADTERTDTEPVAAYPAGTRNAGAGSGADDPGANGADRPSAARLSRER